MTEGEREPSEASFCACCKLSHFNCVQLFATLWTVAHRAPLSMGFSRQKYWSGLTCLPWGIFPTQALKLRFLHLQYWQAESLPLALIPLLRALWPWSLHDLITLLLNLGLLPSCTAKPIYVSRLRWRRVLCLHQGTKQREQASHPQKTQDSLKSFSKAFLKGTFEGKRLPW